MSLPDGSVCLILQPYIDSRLRPLTLGRVIFKSNLQSPIGLFIVDRPLSHYHSGAHCSGFPRNIAVHPSVPLVYTFWPYVSEPNLPLQSYILCRSSFCFRPPHTTHSGLRSLFHPPLTETILFNHCHEGLDVPQSSVPVQLSRCVIAYYTFYLSSFPLARRFLGGKHLLVYDPNRSEDLDLLRGRW